MKSSILLALALCSVIFAQDLPPDTIVARVGGKSFTAAELTAILRVNPPEAQKNMMKDPKAFVEQLGLIRALAAMAEKAKLDQESPTKERLEAFRSQTLAQAQITAAIESTLVSAEDQKKFYEANRDRFTQAKVKVLFVAKKALTEPEMKAKADKLLAEIRAGGDFVKLVKEHSDDRESAAKNGDFDQFPRSDKLPENIRTAISSLKPGQVSDPVRVTNGYYLFRLEELTTQSYDQVRDDIFMEIRQSRFNEWLEKIRKSLDVKIENEAFFK